jgi:hypothetical protein
MYMNSKILEDTLSEEWLMGVACGGCNGAGEVARDVPPCAIQQKLTNNNNRGSSPLPNNGGGPSPSLPHRLSWAVKTLKQNPF